MHNWGSTSMKETKGTAMEHSVCNLLWKKASCFCCEEQRRPCSYGYCLPKTWVSDFLWRNWQLNNCLWSDLKHEPWEQLEFIGWLFALIILCKHFQQNASWHTSGNYFSNKENLWFLEDLISPGKKKNLDHLMCSAFWGRRLRGITVNSPTDQLADANSPTYKIK